jgi:hypothetical protein
MTATANDSAKSERSRLFLAVQPNRHSLRSGKTPDNVRNWHFSPANINLPRLLLLHAPL